MTLHAVNLVFATLGFYGLKISEVALAAFLCGQRLHHASVWVGRL